MYYQLPQQRSKQAFVKYVDDLRKIYTIRIEVKDLCSAIEDHQAKRDELDVHLKGTLQLGSWEIQRYTGYKGLHYIWFTHKEDALAVALKFNGRVV